MMLTDRLTIRLQIGESPEIRLEIDPVTQPSICKQLIQFANKASEDLPMFSRTAQCPMCRGFDTRVYCSEAEWKTRYHRCRATACRHKWKTSQAELLTAEEAAVCELPVHSATAQCPHCRSWNTGSLRTRQKHGIRTHTCAQPDCGKVFETRMSEYAADTETHK